MRKFAAKRGQVAAGKATQEYQNPVAFFENTKKIGKEYTQRT